MQKCKHFVHILPIQLHYTAQCVLRVCIENADIEQNSSYDEGHQRSFTSLTTIFYRIFMLCIVRMKLVMVHFSWKPIYVRMWSNEIVRWEGKCKDSYHFKSCMCANFRKCDSFLLYKKLYILYVYAECLN